MWSGARVATTTLPPQSASREGSPTSPLADRNLERRVAISLLLVGHEKARPSSNVGQVVFVPSCGEGVALMPTSSSRVTRGERLCHTRPMLALHSIYLSGLPPGRMAHVDNIMPGSLSYSSGIAWCGMPLFDLNGLPYSSTAV